MFPAYLKPLSNFFRKRRNRRLHQLVEQLSSAKGGPIDVLDIGGSLGFWRNIPENVRAKCNVVLLNLPGAYEADQRDGNEILGTTVSLLTGDARDLSRFGDSSFDLIVCNSVLEHVGSWSDMKSAAEEARRVGRRGLVQVPAFEFPIEQHYLLPFIHWFAFPIQVKLLALLHRDFTKWSFHDQHMLVHHTQPLTRTELQELFPGAEISREWVVLPKSHSAFW
ncbi:MAG: class I SAM-dependent methyltransferase [Rhodopseudomonas sp.]|uniref:class I SAM-dependent methyltransferase n=1 Tax=Rhodopseudomonas sp. TaxID=1078 RepID=UPI00182F7CAD|nr:class I SAM-dependent methyltransferase [Rhodopseudomonas sp.]NVN84588.1 class I SAM-dependent methyltransferase [Rhodopseudomonas sp.]